mgnify:CR=1 FL=1
MMHLLFNIYDASSLITSASKSFLLMGAVPTHSQTIPPAILEISAAKLIFCVAAYTTLATAITVSPAPLTSAILRIWVGIN